MRLGVALVCLVLWAVHAQAQPEGYVEDGRDIYVVCAPCHGPEGQGGGGGVYPRLAGLPMAYLVSQLNAFKARERINIPMFPFTVERELGEQEVLDVAAYISEMKLESRVPDMPDTIDGYSRLLAMKRVLQIPRAPGDADKGAAVYQASCARCHGDKGEGRPHDPPLGGQHIKYLQKQFADILADTRMHPRPQKIMMPLSETDIENLLAYFSSLDD